MCKMTKIIKTTMTKNKMKNKITKEIKSKNSGINQKRKIPF